MTLRPTLPRELGVSEMRSSMTAFGREEKRGVDPLAGDRSGRDLGEFGDGEAEEEYDVDKSEVE